MIQANFNVFLNDYKKKDSHPDFRGKAEIDGEEHECAVWVKQTRNGDDYLSISIKEPYQSTNDNGNRERVRRSQSDTGRRTSIAQARRQHQHENASQSDSGAPASNGSHKRDDEADLPF